MADSTTDSTQELPFAVPPRAFRLCVVRGDERATRTLHRGMTIVIGSSEEADLSLSDPTVSARHCEVSDLKEGLLVRDLKSKNGLTLGAGKIDSFILRGCRGVFTIGHTRVVVDAGPELEEGGEFGLLGSSEAMQRIRSEIRSLAPLRGAVLISGESGTGKDLVARALHEQSGRAGQFCPLNVAALSESLLDAELFGHEKGAFTGAAFARRGLFEVAHRGTLFLDEIAELS